jgi:hypothetical protein
LLNKQEFELTSFFFFLPFPKLSGVGFSLCCDKDSAIIFTTSRLPDVNPPWEYADDP